MNRAVASHVSALRATIPHACALRLLSARMRRVVWRKAGVDSVLALGVDAGEQTDGSIGTLTVPDHHWIRGKDEKP